MFNKLPLRYLPAFPDLARVSTKLALGMVFATFLLGYQPTFKFPPIKKNIVHAQNEQAYSVNAQALPIEFQLPHPGYVSTNFSYYHPGMDIASGLGMPIKPVAKGTVAESGYNFWGLGLIVVVDHGYGYKSLYAHMGKIYVKKDQSVDSKDYLGEIGLTGHTTGPHTHLEITKEGKAIDPSSILPKMRQNPEASDFVPVKNTKVSEKPDLSKQIKASL